MVKIAKRKKTHLRSKVDHSKRDRTFLGNCKKNHTKTTNILEFTIKTEVKTLHKSDPYFKIQLFGKKE